METLVAISILSISVLGTFTAVQSSLQNSEFAKDQITAFYLIQESMEYIRNIRDTNGISSNNSVSSGGSAIPWLTSISNQASDPCYFGKTCTIDGTTGTSGIQTCSGGFGSCQYLRQDTVTSLFGYNSGWPVSRFKREVQIQSVSANEVVITVSLSWLAKGSTKTLLERETLFNWH